MFPHYPRQNYTFYEPLMIDYLVEQRQCSAWVEYIDQIIWSDDRELMRRFYSTKNWRGRAEASEKLALIIKIRGKNHDKWMYAAMLDSAIKEVFLRFLRRRQNRIAADTSSESALSSQSVQTYSSFFLKSISESSRSVKLDLLSQSSLNLSDSCPSQIYNVFQVCSEMIQDPLKIEFMLSTSQKEKQIKHLIHSFNEPKTPKTNIKITPIELTGQNKKLGPQKILSKTKSSRLDSNFYRIYNCPEGEDFDGWGQDLTSAIKRMRKKPFRTIEHFNHTSFSQERKKGYQTS